MEDNERTKRNVQLESGITKRTRYDTVIQFCPSYQERFYAH